MSHRKDATAAAAGGSLRTVEQRLVLVVLLDRHLRGSGQGSRGARPGRDHRDAAGHGLAVLVDAPAVELDGAAVGPLRAGRDGRRHRVADTHRPEEPQVLRLVHGARPGELRPENAGDQRAAPKVMAHQPARVEVAA